MLFSVLVLPLWPGEPRWDKDWKVKCIRRSDILTLVKKAGVNPKKPSLAYTAQAWWLLCQYRECVSVYATSNVNITHVSQWRNASDSYDINVGTMGRQWMVIVKGCHGDCFTATISPFY